MISAESWLNPSCRFGCLLTVHDQIADHGLRVVLHPIGITDCYNEEMIGLFLITHATYGESLIQCACHVLNKRPLQIAQLGVSLQDDPLDLLPLARDMLKLVDAGDGVLIMTDLYGATPSNITSKLLIPGHVEGLAGVNLPMLLRALTYRDKGMDTLLTRAIAGGRDGVLNITDH